MDPEDRQRGRGLPGGGPPGAIRPDRRLAINAGPFNVGAFAKRLRRPVRDFPWVAPSWPTTVPRPPVERTLGVHYDTAWARRYPSRFARLLLTEAVTTPVMKALANPTVLGLDRIAHLDGPVVFAANHASHLDTPLLLSVIPEPWRHRTVVAAGADYFFDTRIKAAAFSLAINAIPIERTRVSRASANQAAVLLDAGWSLLIFPEGGRSPDGWAQPHTRGAAWLGVRTGLPVVPIHVEGTSRILARHAKRIRPGSTRVSFGKPLRSDSGTDARQLAEGVERAVTALSDEGTTDWWTATKRAAARTSPSLTGPQAAGSWRRRWALGDRRRERRHPGDHRRWPDS
ncbi:MAG: 1-acyl-sn-glycerol-3-phosphate acyltransferase [Actinomycetota bacterium]|nr:1-acyl-sn-glycerol-3-phosphate acyltransferase [Actinomycetota bacterium]